MAQRSEDVRNAWGTVWEARMYSVGIAREENIEEKRKEYLGW